jgi:putative MFS transporter
MSKGAAKQPLYSFWIILITGLGFFIDSYDVFSYNVMRVPSLTDLGLSGDTLTRSGMMILNWQVFGTLIGGFFWGLLGDKIGRKRALLGSICVYSLGMLANSIVENVTLYAIIRFIIGFGIAGEVGLAATLVAESLPAHKRTFGLAFLTLLGLLGVAAAALAIEFFHWRMICACGGVAGLVLLVLRHLLLESPLFTALSQREKFLGPLKNMINSPLLLRRYLACIFILAPSFFVTGVLLTLAPEIAEASGITAPVKANLMIAGYFIVAVSGDIFGATLSHLFRSRKKILLLFMMGNLLLAVLYLHNHHNSPALLYTVGALFGLFNLWALAATVAVESMPTALRATVSTSVLNLSRAMIIVFNLVLLGLKPHFGLLGGLTVIGAVIFALGLLAVMSLRETFAVDLDDPSI